MSMTNNAGTYGQCRLLTIEDHAAFALLACGQNSRQHAVELFNGKVLADVAIRAGMECGIRIDGFDDYQVGDSIESYTIEKVAPKL